MLATSACGTPQQAQSVATPAGQPLQAAPALAAGQPAHPAAGRAPGSESAAVVDYLKVADAIYATTVVDEGELSRVSAEGAYDEVVALAAELNKNGYRQRGKVAITKITLSDRADGARIARTCVNANPVSVVDTTGHVVRPVNDRDGRGRGNRTSLHDYQLQRINDGWVVVGHAMPDDATCPGAK